MIIGEFFSKRHLTLFFFFIIFSCQKKHEETMTEYKLWYNEPANAFAVDDPIGWEDDPEWLKALPIGNGSLGGMVFGDVYKERIQINEESLWSGSQENSDNPEAFPALNEIRNLLFEKKYTEATELTDKTQICKGVGTGHGKGANVPFGSYQTLGDLWIEMENQLPYQDYYRELDLNDALFRMHYTQDSILYQREMFVSHPDQLMVIRLTASQPGKISFKCSLTRPEVFHTKTENDQLIMYGTLTDGKDGEGMQYMTRLSAMNLNGNVTYTNDQIIVKDADEVILLLSASTDYVLDYPEYKGRAYKDITNSNIENGKASEYKTLLDRHIKDYQYYFNRVDFSLSQDTLDGIPTDLRVQNFNDNPTDLKLVELIYQYGRYLLISSSRPGDLPANLQGIWSNKIQSAWNGDYHTNINVEMNYWPAETTNLSEMHLPLMDLMASLQEPGSKTAKVHYNCGGWVLHPITNVWGFTSPGEVSDWGMHLGGGAWLTTHLMEHYYFTLDRAFLEAHFPILNGSVAFYLDWLIPHPETGELVSGPSNSPENMFYAPDGSVNKICMGPAHDHQVIWQLFKNFIDANAALGIEDELLPEVIEAQANLAQPTIGSDGRLLEWNEEFQEVDPGHRHFSHLFAMHPGYQIDIKTTPKLAIAAKKSLDFRIENGGGQTGWSAAWLINQYARLGAAGDALNNLQIFLSNQTSPNLFGQHPPFQMDGNFGVTAGITEMLLQSHTDEIRLLPALPSSWQNGKIRGICARGGFVIDMKWRDGDLIELKVFSKKGGQCTLDYRGQKILIKTKANKSYYPIKVGKK